MKKQIISIFAISLVLLMAVLVSADCKIKFTSQINDYQGTSFEAGIINGASDSYDPLYDVLQVGMPGGKYMQMATIINDNLLAKDFRSDADTKKWQIMKIAVDPDYEGLSGTDALTWTIDCSDTNIKLSLIDYGTDSGRTSIVKTIDLRATSSYNTDASAVMGPYRYLNLVLDKTITCTENWKCTAWSKCAEQKQARTCTDSNKCGTTTNKPAETQSCVESTGSSDILAGSSDIIYLDQPTSEGSSDIIKLNSSQETTQKSLLDIIVNFFMGLF